MKRILMLQIVIILISLVMTNVAADHDSTGHCIWYGECNKNSWGLPQNCVYDGPAKPLDLEGQVLLAKWCPHMFVEPNAKDIYTCCDKNQLKTMNESLTATNSLLQRCPSCMTNLVRHICESTCAQNQSRFLEVLDKKESVNGKQYIDAINFYINNDYIENTFVSCKEVKVLNTGELAIDFMCGEWGSSNCTALRWFHYMGDSIENVLVPFMINYKNTSDQIGQFQPLNPPTVPCNEGIKNKTPACSCADCPASCPLRPVYPPSSEPFKIFGFDGYNILISVIFLLGTSLFLVCIVNVGLVWLRRSSR